MLPHSNITFSNLTNFDTHEDWVKKLKKLILKWIPTFGNIQQIQKMIFTSVFIKTLLTRIQVF